MLSNCIAVIALFSFVFFFCLYYIYMCVCVRVCVCFFFSFLISILYVNVRNALIKKYLKKNQNQIYSQNQLRNAQTSEALRQRKSAYNSLFVSVVFLACYFPFFPCTILYMANTSEISFLIAQYASFFLICLNSSLNPLVYCWRYREIRQIVKNTVKKIIHMNENMT